MGMVSPRMSVKDVPVIMIYRQRGFRKLPDRMPLPVNSVRYRSHYSEHNDYPAGRIMECRPRDHRQDAHCNSEPAPERVFSPRNLGIYILIDDSDIWLLLDGTIVITHVTRLIPGG